MPEYPAYAAAPVAVPSGGTGDRSVTAFELLAGGTDGLSSLQQISSGTAGWRLTSNGPGVLPSFQPGGGGAGITQMPWNVLGGWSGSTFDPAAASESTGLYTIGSIHVAAIVTDGVAPFSKVGLQVQTSQSGSGSLLTVTDSSGNHLASGTNVDTVLNETTADLYYVTLNTTLTPPVAQTVYYVAWLFPSTVSVAAGLVVGGSSNWQADQTKVAFVNLANTSSTTNTSIPDPLNIGAMTGVEVGVPFFVLK